MLLLLLLVFGLFYGWLAQLILGKNMYRVDWTLALFAGVLGSLLGGLILSLLVGDGIGIAPSGIIGSTIGALIVTVLYQRWWLPRRA